MKKLMKSGLGWLWLTVLVLVVDQLTKGWVMARFELYESQALLSWLNVTYVHNYGAAFSFLHHAGGWQRWMFSAIAIGVSALLLFWLARISYRQWLQGSAYSLILGGALGNLVDRSWHGFVVDFIDFHLGQWHWPAFNVADSAICIGAALIAWEALRGQPEASRHG